MKEASYDQGKAHFLRNMYEGIGTLLHFVIVYILFSCDKVFKSERFVS